MVPWALFGTFAALAWWALDLMAAGKPRQLERLEELKDPNKRRKAQSQSALKKSDAMTRMLEKASPALAKPLQPKNAGELSKLKAKLAHAGFRGEAAGSIFLGFKFVGLVVGLVLGGGTYRLASRLQSYTRWNTRSHWRGLLFYLPDLVVGFIGKQPETGHLPRLARRSGPDGGLRRGRLGPRPGDAQGGRRNAQDVSHPGRGVCHLQLPVADGPPTRRSAPRTGLADRRARFAVLGGGAHSDRPLRLERGPGAADAERLDAHPRGVNWRRRRRPRRRCN